MTHDQFISQIDEPAVVAAIREAEARSTGEIRVFITCGKVTEPMAAAAVEFAKLGMNQTKDRNGVLIYISPRARTFAIVGDEAIDRRAGARVWEDAASALTAAFIAERWTRGIVEAIRLAGDALAQWFPPDPGTNRNELPDAIARDHRAAANG
jgi:uncharacterized membrane protein